MPGINYSAHQYNPIAQGQGAAIASAKASSTEKSSGFSFDDFLDVINPLQHIPVVSTLYRHLTGDKISTPAKIAGDTLYGGVTGFIGSVADTAFQEVTGKSVGDTVYAMVFDDDKKTPAATGYASADAPVAVTPASSEPSLRGFFDTIDSAATDAVQATSQVAAQAYRSAGRLLAAY